MSFNHKQYNQRYVDNFETTGAPANDATHKQVRVEAADVPDGAQFWCAIGVRHLTPVENQARHNAFVEALDENGQRLKDPNLRIGWTWEGRSSDQNAPPAGLDKPDNEPAGNVPIEKGMNLEVWLQGDGLPCDHVLNMHTRHDDELGPDGEIWNSFGHHSYYVVYQRTVKAAGGDQPPVTPPPVEPPTEPPVVPPTEPPVEPPTSPTDETLSRRLLEEGEANQVIQFNPDAALQKRVFADNFVPNSSEFTVEVAGVSYVAQRAEHLGSGEVRIYFARMGDWDNVQFVRRGEG